MDVPELFDFSRPKKAEKFEKIFSAKFNGPLGRYLDNLSCLLLSC